MEDTTTLTEFSTFPAAFLAIYDGHGGTLAARLLQQMLHRFLLDELLVTSHEADVCREVASVEGRAGVDPQSACSTPPYDVDDRRVVANCLLNTEELDVCGAFSRAYGKMDAVLKSRRCVCVGATAVTCLLRQVPNVGRLLTVANCGDARAVLSRGGRAVRLSEDHRPGLGEESERVERDGGFVCGGGRVNGVLNVSRAFGDHCMKSVVVSTPFCRQILLGPTDEFVVLGCDGLWDFVSEDVVVGLAREGFDRGLGSGEVSELLVREAIERKSTDNVSVVVLLLDVEE